MHTRLTILSLQFLYIVFSFMGLACQSNSSTKTPEEVNEEQISRTVDSTTLEEISLDTVPKEYLLGKFEPSKDSNFVQIKTPYGAGNGLGYIRTETYDAFLEMHKAAKADGISLVIKSPTRNFYRQKAIWENKWTGKTKVGGKDLSKSVVDPKERALTILRYSSMPGTSRHHWGTDIDINEFENSYFKSGKGLKEYEWLVANAHKYGFCQPYTPKGQERPNGYEEERWHWSYTPLAKEYLASYKVLLTHDDIFGFQGSEVAADIDVISNYVFGINEICK